MGGTSAQAEPGRYLKEKKKIEVRRKRHLVHPDKPKRGREMGKEEKISFKVTTKEAKASTPKTSQDDTRRCDIKLGSENLAEKKNLSSYKFTVA